MLTRVGTLHAVRKRGFDWYVDSANGSDGNTGKSSLQALRTITALLGKTFTPGQKIGLARGSAWREQLTIPCDNIHVAAYGAGARPLLDCSDVIAADEWTKTAGQTNVYQATVPVEQTNQFFSLWEDDVRFRLATSLANCDATPSTYFTSSLESSPVTVYVHASDGTNPATNGRAYEYSRRAQGLYCPHDHCSISGIETRRNLSNNGSFEVRRFCSVSDCRASEGTKHNILVGGGCTLTGVEAADAYYAGQSKVLMVWNQDIGQGEDVTFINCHAHDEFDPEGQCAFYGHVNVSGGFGCVTLRGCRAGQVLAAVPAFDAQQVVIDGCDLWVVSVMAPTTITNSTIRGNFRCLCLSASPTVTVRDSTILCSYSGIDGGDCAVLIGNDGATLDIQRSSITGTLKDGSANMLNGIWFIGGGTLVSRNNVFSNLAHFYMFDGASYAADSDNNKFDGPILDTSFRVPGWTWKTLAEWKALGYDANSTP